ncbi:hypothetical protein IV38_GL001017 [Lactobacillus selangorensis]|uniref:Acetyltransferase n=1 Tax=Lactobacillus selangorensis TaxID=81857 RepID=A0A0R2FUC4_9LACO|nr:sugar O-acetyltransferase [Lactobacillus selangorensis]KRN28812.1 hypothetical protein IV38_GL001017 [Lactobacillus selangorensis]KRN32778.1 hypothetical protein IV40_GL000836 [Lactobacillus selangorensis]
MEKWQAEMTADVWYADTLQMTAHRNQTRDQLAEISQIADNELRNGEYAKLLGHVGADFFVETGFSFSFGANITIGDDFYANKDVLLCDEGQITIGKHCKIGPRAAFYTPLHPLDAAKRRTGVEKVGPITLGDDVWIGGSATILPNVTLGNDVVVGAGSVVTKSFPNHVVIAGNPARIIRHLNQTGH